MTFRPITAVRWLACRASLLLCSLGAAAQTQSIPLTSGPVLPLYRALRSVGLDPQRVFTIREAVIDREDVHVWLNDGTIAFTQAVDGRVTGAYFEGEGEVLVRPPDRMERASLGLFTGAGVLEEKIFLRLSALQRQHGQGAGAVLAPGGGRCRFRRPQRREGACAGPDGCHAALHLVHQRAVSSGCW